MRALVITLLALAACRNPSNEAGASPAASSQATPGCIAIEKKLTECGLTAAAAGVGTPCDERVAACMVGQGCEAIRAKKTGCVFE